MSGVEANASLSSANNDYCGALNQSHIQTDFQATISGDSEDRQSDDIPLPLAKRLVARYSSSVLADVEMCSSE